jgi:chemotaxis protein methyltransferase CheR
VKPHRAPAAAMAEPTAATLAVVARIAEADAGIVLSESKAGLVQSRLAPRLRALGLTDYADYVRFVETDAGRSERRAMIAALTTNISHFFREQHHFDLLRHEILPPLVARARAGGRIRIWSAGCSQGQEVFSAAMVLLDLMPDAAAHDVRLLASDIDAGVLARARTGTFPAQAAREIPAQYLGRFAQAGASGLQVSGVVRTLVRFRELNLNGSWPMQGRFDVIFCRNVMIYFGADRQAALWPRFAGALEPEGWLLVGHSERAPCNREDPFESAGLTAYRPRSNANRNETGRWR